MENTINFIPSHESPPNTLTELTAYVTRRSAFFLNRLANLLPDSPAGWESISNGTQGIVKSSSINPKDRMFTGKFFCEAAANALYEGLTDFVSNDAFEIDIVSLQTAFNAEDWPIKVGRPNTHDLIRVTEKSTGNIRFIDPTYGQVDHRKTGKFQISTLEELGEYYKNGEGTLELQVVTQHRQKGMMADLLDFIPNDRYNALVATISDKSYPNPRFTF